MKLINSRNAAIVVFALCALFLFREEGQLAEKKSHSFVREQFAAAQRHFAESLSYRTVSQGGEVRDYREFRKFHAFLERSYPLVHKTMKRISISKASLLYEWKGTRAELKPIVFTAHIDVVPADDGGKDSWKHPPFSGAIAEGHIWGRGARDFKPGLIGLMEAAESLIAGGFRPERSVYLAFGEDEEIQGFEGAKKIADYMLRRHIRPEAVIDEGGGVTKGMFPGVDKERFVALVAVAEKGYLTLELSARGKGGHSSSHSGDNPLVILAGAIGRLQKKPFRPDLHPVIRQMFEALTPGASFPMGAVYGNLWLAGPILKRSLLTSGESEGMARTTMALTVFKGGSAENVVPERAFALINIRLMPGTTVKDALDHVSASIGDPRVTVSVKGRGGDAPPVSSLETENYRRLSRVIRGIFKDALVAPSLTAGTTDVRHYAPVCGNLYRFAPSISTRSFSGNGHKADERLPLDNFPLYPVFYTELIAAMARE